MPSAARANAVGRGSGKPAKNVLAALSAAHWAMQPDMLRTMISIASRSNAAAQAIEAIEAERGERLEKTWDVEIRDGIATIPIHGAVFRYADLFTYMSGGATYENLAEDFLTALRDPAVKGILFDIDSPGGEVHGCQNLARLIAANRDQKPMAVFGAGDVCSAAYWQASAIGRVIVSPTTIMGSIGCCATITDFSKWQEDEGIEEIQIVSSQSPKKNRDPKTPEGRSDIEAVLDALAQVFIEDVAEFRGVDVETVLSDFGQGGVFVGAAAVAAGLADDVGFYDDVHAELLDRAASGGTTTVIIGAARAQSHTNSGEATVADKTPAGSGQPAAQQANADAPANADPNAPDENDKKKKDEQDQQDQQPSASALEKAMKAERERVLGIQALRRNASEDAIIAACVADPKCTIADAALKLRTAEASSGSQHIAALKGDEQNAPAPAAPASGSGTPNAATEVVALSDSIVNAGKPAAQRASR